MSVMKYIAGQLSNIEALRTKHASNFDTESFSWGYEGDNLTITSKGVVCWLSNVDSTDEEILGGSIAESETVQLRLATECRPDLLNEMADFIRKILNCEHRVLTTEKSDSDQTAQPSWEKIITVEVEVI